MASARERSSKRSGPAFRAQVHQHDLAVEAAEVVAVEGAYDVLLVVAEALGQGGVVALGRQPVQRGALGALDARQGKELQHRRAGELPGQQETPRLQVGEAGLPGGPQALGVTLGELGELPLVGGGGGVQFGCRREPVGEQGGALVAACRLLGQAPARVVVLEQRQVEQPLAGVVEQVQGQLPGLPAEQAAPGRTVADRQAQFADAAGRLRPVRRGGVERRHGLVVGKARHAQVLLVDPASAEQATLAGHRQQVEVRLQAGVTELVDQRGQKRGLARARQASDRQAKLAVTAALEQVMEFASQGLAHRQRFPSQQDQPLM